MIICVFHEIFLDNRTELWRSVLFNVPRNEFMQLLNSFSQLRLTFFHVSIGFIIV
jgi:hypothetical protein